MVSGQRSAVSGQLKANQKPKTNRHNVNQLTPRHSETSPPGPLGQSYLLSAVSCQLKTKCKTQIAIWTGEVNSQIPGFCRGDRPVALESGKQQSAGNEKQKAKTNKHNAGKMTIGSHKGTKGKAAISGQLSAVSQKALAIRTGDVNSICSYHFSPYSLPAARSF